MTVIIQHLTAYLEPQSLGEVYELTSAWGERAKIVAGGTDLLVRMKQRVCKPEVLISLQKVKEMREITGNSDGISIGGAVRLSETIASPAICEEYPLLAEAASKVGAYQHRQMGTIGGNLCLEPRCQYLNQSHFLRNSLGPCLKAGGEVCHVVKGKKCYAVYSGDTAPALLALGARVLIGSSSGERWADLAQIYSGDGLTPFTLQKGEVLIRVLIGREAVGAGGVYLKLAERVAIDYPSLGVAAAISLDGNRVSRAELAFTAAGSAPFSVEETNNLLGAKELTEALLESILGAASKRVVLVKNRGFSVGYRRAMVKKMARAALKMAWKKASGQEGGCCREL